MFCYKTCSFRDTFQNYINTNSSIQSLLSKLGFMIISFDKHHFSKFYALFREQKNPLAIFKLLILIHFCLNTQIYLNPQKIIDCLQCIKTKSKGEFQKYIEREVNVPYIKYLQKRFYFEIDEVDQRGERQDQKDNCQEFQIQKLFQYLNLIRSGVAFNRTIFTLGRYYSRKYGFMTEYNKVLAADFQDLYARLKIHFQKISQQSVFYSMLLKEIQLLNEKMFAIYFNCYFARSMNKFVPEWINTDSLLFQKKSLKSSKNSSNCSTTCFSLKKCLEIEGDLEQSEESQENKEEDVKEVQKIIQELMFYEDKK